MGKHTELPWVTSTASCVKHRTETVAIYHYPSEVKCVEVVETGCKCGDEALSAEDAEFIVRAVNNHARLLEALREAVSRTRVNSHDWVQGAAALLAQLDGELE